MTAKKVIRKKVKKKDPSKSKAAQVKKKNLKDTTSEIPTPDTLIPETKSKKFVKSRIYVGKRGESPTGYAGELVLERKWTDKQIEEKVREKFPSSNFKSSWVSGIRRDLLRKGAVDTKIPVIKKSAIDRTGNDNIIPENPAPNKSGTNKKALKKSTKTKTKK